MRSFKDSTSIKNVPMTGNSDFFVFNMVFVPVQVFYCLMHVGYMKNM